MHIVIVSVDILAQFCTSILPEVSADSPVLPSLFLCLLLSMMQVNQAIDVTIADEGLSQIFEAAKLQQVVRD